MGKLNSKGIKPMHIKEGLKLLMEGKKITHSKWGKNDYISFDQDNESISFYTLDYQPFCVDVNLLISEGWASTDKSFVHLSFVEALTLLQRGIKIMHDDFDFDYLEMDIAQNLIAVSHAKREFILSHQSLFSMDWREYDHGK